MSRLTLVAVSLGMGILIGGYLASIERPKPSIDAPPPPIDSSSQRTVLEAEYSQCEPLLRKHFIEWAERHSLEVVGNSGVGMTALFAKSPEDREFFVELYFARHPEGSELQSSLIVRGADHEARRSAIAKDFAFNDLLEEMQVIGRKCDIAY